MTVSSGFFNSVNHDRLYDAEQLSSIFDGIIVDGVYENYGEALNVTAYPDANSTVIVGTGRAWFDHTWTLNDSQFSITIDPPNELLDRTDAIVIDVDKTKSVRKNSIIYVKGSESTPDLPPSFINTDLHKQYPLCYISRPAGSNKPVTQSDITITVGTSVCPMVTGILEAQNLENLMQQLDDEFNTWWDGIKDTLDENTVTNLQNQINELKDKIEGDGALVGLLEKPIADAFMSGDYGLTIKSFTLSKKLNASVLTGTYDSGNQYTDTWYANGYFLDGYRPFLFFLPDGKVAWTYFLRDNSTGGYDNHTIIQVCLATKQGVQTYSSKCVDFVDYTLNDYSDAVAMHDRFYSYDSYGTIANLSCDTYPVTYDICVSSAMPVSGPIGISVIHITITSAGVINISDPVLHTSTAAGTKPGSAVNSYTSVYSYKLSSGSTLIPLIGYYASALNSVYIICKISSNGVVEHPSNRLSYTWPTNMLSTVYNAGKAIIIDEIDGKIVFGNPDSKTEYSVLDENNLTISNSSGELSIFPRDNKTNYEVETYSLSEANGVQVTSSIIGSNNKFETSQKSKYFIGANNSGDAIPEGTLIAANDDGRLYGIVSGGKQVAIGTNGGAAILKTTKTSGSINATNVMKIHKGFINVDSSSGYIQYTGVNKRNASISNPTVFFISREVSDASTV